MKKVILAMFMLSVVSSFTSCTDLTEEDERTFEIQQIEPADDGTIDEEDYREEED